MKRTPELFQHLRRLRPTEPRSRYGPIQQLRSARTMKRSIRELGFQIAVRPLPKGMPLGASAARQ